MILTILLAVVCALVFLNLLAVLALLASRWIRPKGIAAPSSSATVSEASAVTRPATTMNATRSSPWGWILLALLVVGLVAFAWWVTKDSQPRPAATTPQAQIPSPSHYKNVPHTEQEISVLGYSEEQGTEKVDYSTLRVKKGGEAKYKFCIKEKISPGEIWMLNLAMFAEKATPGGNKEVVIIQINGTSQEIRLELGWVPDHEKLVPGNITIKPGATIGGCENELSISSLTGPVNIKGPIKVIRRM